MANNENDNDAAQVYLLGKTYLANNQGQFYIRNDPIVQMASGDRHTLIITESGRAFAFGDNGSGQLGLGHTNNVEKVSCIKSLKFGDTGERVILAACGRESSLVATNRGSIYAFGSNNRSQLGIESKDTTMIHTQPSKIEHFRGKINWKQISMGAEHACALTEDGLVYVWGSNEDGQCGQPRKNDTIKIPRELRVEYQVVAISCGYYHTALVSSDGRLFLFGNNDDRQLGRSVPDQFVGPVEVSLPDKVKGVACGNQHTVVLTEKGDVYTCGHGDRGQLGLGHKVHSAETFEFVPGLPKRLTAVAAGEAHTIILGSRGDIYVCGDGKHGKLGSQTHSNEFEPCLIDKFKSYNVLKVVCGGCQTIVLAQKKTTDQKKSSGSEDDISNATLSVTQRPKSVARNLRNEKITNRSSTFGDSLDATIQHAKPLRSQNHLRVEADDDDKSDKELSESLKSATFNQTHTLTNGRFKPTQSPSLNRTTLRSIDDDSKPLKTGVLDRTARLNKDTDDLNKTNNRLPALDKSPLRNTRFDQSSPQTLSKKKSDSDEDKPPIRNTRFDKSNQQILKKKKSESDEDKSSSEEQPSKSFTKKSDRSSPPLRNDRKPSPITRRKNTSESDEDKKVKRSSPPTKTPMSETLNRKSRQPPRRNIEDSEDEEDDDDDDNDEDNPRLSSRHSNKPPPTAARRSSLPPQARAGAPNSSSRDGNQTIGSKPSDAARGSFRSPATKTLAKPTTNNSNADTSKKETPPAQQPGFFSRIFGAKSTPPPPPPPPQPPAAAPSTTNSNSRTCLIM
ncbi:unnamed protein product [Adineta steineri]|uniref:RCC1-like domain-containing protein n=1 Tax=Adineta steineri TaxID=433720 RepID=A0A819A548_9BILA|nr:unnamed protein product [Adineta steineri]